MSVSVLTRPGAVQVRESGDHSAINSWDRMPYIHDLGPGGPAKPTVVPLTRREHHNFILGTYSTQEAFDTVRARRLHLLVLGDLPPLAVARC